MSLFYSCSDIFIIIIMIFSYPRQVVVAYRDKKATRRNVNSTSRFILDNKRYGVAIRQRLLWDLAQTNSATPGFPRELIPRQQ